MRRKHLRLSIRPPRSSGKFLLVGGFFLWFVSFFPREERNEHSTNVALCRATKMSRRRRRHPAQAGSQAKGCCAGWHKSDSGGRCPPAYAVSPPPRHRHSVSFFENFRFIPLRYIRNIFTKTSDNRTVSMRRQRVSHDKPAKEDVIGANNGAG